MAREDQVTTPQSEEVTPSDASQSTGVPGEGMASPGVVDGDQIALLQAQLKTYERDMDRLRSSYDRQGRRKEEEWQTRLTEAETRMNDFLLAQMDDADRQAYILERQEADIRNLREALAAEKQRAQNAELMTQYHNAFVRLGIDPQKLDYNDPETLSESAWMALEDILTDQRNQIERLKAAAQSVSPPPKTDETTVQPTSTPKAPKVVTSHGKVTEGITTPAQLLADLRSKFGDDLQEDDIKRLVRSGQLDPSIFESLDPETMY